MKYFAYFLLFLGLSSCVEVINQSGERIIVTVLVRKNQKCYSDEVLDSIDLYQKDAFLFDAFFLENNESKKLSLASSRDYYDSVDILFQSPLVLEYDSVKKSEFVFERQSFSITDLLDRKPLQIIFDKNQND